MVETVLLGLGYDPPPAPLTFILNAGHIDDWLW